MGTLSASPTAITYKNILFSKGSFDKIYYTDGSDNDVEITSFSSSFAFTGALRANAGLGIGTSPTRPFDIYSTNNPQQRISYDPTHYLDIYVNSDGYAVLNTSHGQFSFSADELRHVGDIYSSAGDFNIYSIDSSIYMKTAGITGNHIAFQANTLGGYINIFQVETEGPFEIKYYGGLFEHVNGTAGTDTQFNTKRDFIIKLDNGSNGGTRKLILQNSSGTEKAYIDDSGNMAIDGDLTVEGNDIKSSTGATAITLAVDDVTIADDLKLGGNVIQASDGTTAITTSGANVTFGGKGVFTTSASVTATNKIYLDGDGGHTYIHESSADNVKIVVGGEDFITLTEGDDDKIKFHKAVEYYGDGSSKSIIHNVTLNTGHHSNAWYAQGGSFEQLGGINLGFNIASTVIPSSIGGACFIAPTGSIKVKKVYYGIYTEEHDMAWDIKLVKATFNNNSTGNPTVVDVVPSADISTSTDNATYKGSLTLSGTSANLILAEGDALLLYTKAASYNNGVKYLYGNVSIEFEYI
tara:strand:+ start:46066 stop:47637 length:1572 start_codon:yes stop_codon:yes gene_type:complete